MRHIILLSATLTLVLAAKYRETLNIADSNGKAFKCVYTIAYNGDGLVDGKSTVACSPKKNGAPYTAEINVPDLGKTVSVSHNIRKGRETITSIEILEPTPTSPTTPSSPTTATSPMNCSCRLPLSGPLSSSPPMAMGRVLIRGGGSYHGYGYGHGHGHGHGLSSGSSGGLSSIIPLVGGLLLGAALSALLPILLPALVNFFFGPNRTNRKLELADLELDQASLLAKLTDRQLLGNIFGNLGNVPAPAPSPASGGVDLTSLLGGASGGGSNDFVNQLVMQMVQQQMDDFINNGGAQEALTNMVESGQLEEAVQQMMDSGMLEQLVQQLLESGLLEQAAQSIVSVVMEETLQSLTQATNENMPTFPPFLQNMGFNGGWGDFLEQMNMTTLLTNQMNISEMMANVNMNSMELEMDCTCVTPS